LRDWDGERAVATSELDGIPVYIATSQGIQYAGNLEK
jgi:uncharacterized protein (DUF779 family)